MHANKINIKFVITIDKHLLQIIVILDVFRELPILTNVAASVLIRTRPNA